MAELWDYEPIVGRGIIEELELLAERLSGKVVQMISSTPVGGGVAEILSRMVPLLNQLGVKTAWDVIKGSEEFFQVTKGFHNVLQGRQAKILPNDFFVFGEGSRRNLDLMDFYGDIMFVHDPQPIALVMARKEKGRRWVWRCHIDVSTPDLQVWDFLCSFIARYDAVVFSAPQFAQPLPIRQFLISPSIDPLSDKNRELSDSEIQGVLAKYGITSEKPIITQISRFDHFKDPLGVIDVFNMVRKRLDCQLILAGGPAVDDPESAQVLASAQEKARGNPDIHVLFIPPESHVEINALQRAATVVVQKSLREGFGLTVSEALWKAKPVVAAAVGGIPLQVKHKTTGLLTHGVPGTAYALKLLLSNPEYAIWLGNNGREYVRQNFLLTRHIRDYLLLLLSLDHFEDVVYL